MFLAACGIAQLPPGYLIFVTRLLCLYVRFGYFVCPLMEGSKTHMNRPSLEVFADRRGGGGGPVVRGPTGGCPVVGLLSSPRPGAAATSCYSPCYTPCYSACYSPLLSVRQLRRMVFGLAAGPGPPLAVRPLPVVLGRLTRLAAASYVPYTSCCGERNGDVFRRRLPCTDRSRRRPAKKPVAEPRDHAA